MFEAVDGGDVGMVERRQQPGFALESGQPFWFTGKNFGQNFQGDFALQARVSRAIDLAHAASADQGQHLVLSQESPWRNGHVSDLSSAAKLHWPEEQINRGRRELHSSPVQMI